MREIKYRVYDEEWGMREVDWICFTNQIATYTLDIDRCSGVGKKPLEEVMQYTGLKDKNGVEIYEDDILTEGSNHFNCVFNENAVWCFKEHNTKIDYTYYDIGPLTICGNIYENPEFLKEIINNV